MKLSMVISAYNCDRFLEKCIRSCFSQDVATGETEIVVVNDGSTDKTRCLLERLSKEVTNMVVIHQPNKGLGAARNAGLLHAGGEYVWFIDADDYIEENCVSDLLKLIRENNPDILAFNYFIENDAYSVTGYGYKYEDLPIVSAIMTGTEYYRSNYQKNYSWQYIFKRKLFTDNGLFFKERINMQDAEILPKVVFYAKKMVFLTKPVYHYVQHPASFTNTHDGEKRFHYFESIIEVRNSLSDFANTIQSEDGILYEAVSKKIAMFHMVIFNHLVFFEYERKWLKKILALLRENDYYPLKYTPYSTGLKLVKWGMNTCPFLTKAILNQLIHKQK